MIYRILAFLLLAPVAFGQGQNWPTGQETMQNSVPVTIASDQAAIPVTVTNPSVGPTGAAVPADATYSGMNVGGNLVGLTGTANGLKVDVQASVAQSVTQGTSPWVDNITQFGGSPVVTGTGTGGAGIPRVTVSNDSTVGLVAGAAIIGAVRIDQTTPGTTNGVFATNFPSTVDTNTGVTGASTPRVVTASHAITSDILASNNYASTNVTTAAYVQLIASTATALNVICLSNSSSSIIKLATGAASSEVDRVYIPGGGAACYAVNIASGTRISLEALDATASTGWFLFTGML